MRVGHLCVLLLLLCLSASIPDEELAELSGVELSGAGGSGAGGGGSGAAPEQSSQREGGMETGEEREGPKKGPTESPKESKESPKESPKESYAQFNQDVLILQHFFGHKSDGVFVEIGAHDGLTYSNTMLMEQKGWTGLLIEANPSNYEQLAINRPITPKVFGAAYDREGSVEFLQNTGYTNMLSGVAETCPEQHTLRMQAEQHLHGGATEIITVPCYEVTSLLLSHNIRDVDFMSIDVEGAEMRILNSIDFSRIKVKVLMVENNYETLAELDALLQRGGFKGYAIIGEDVVYAAIAPIGVLS